MAKYKLTDILKERVNVVVVLDNGNDFEASFYDFDAARKKYPLGKEVDGAEVIDIRTPGGKTITPPPARKGVNEVIDVFGDTTKRKLSAKSAESLKKMLGGKSFRQAMMDSMGMLQKVMQAEQPYRDQLEELAKEVAYNVFPIIKDAGIEIDAQLVSSPQEMKISKPQDEETINNQQEAEQALDGVAEKSGIDKRRIINSITQGAGLKGSRAYYLFDYALDVLDSIGVKDDYEQLMNDSYGIYNDDDAMAMMMAMLSQSGAQGASQGGEAEADYDPENETMTIRAKALTFPILLQEVVKGLYEFISLQGFTGVDKEEGERIVRDTDKIENEPEDLRYGPIIYEALRDLVADEDIQNELFFAKVYQLEQPFFQDFIEAAVNDNLDSGHKGWIQKTIEGIKNPEEDED